MVADRNRSDGLSRKDRNLAVREQLKREGFKPTHLPSISDSDLEDSGDLYINGSPYELTETVTLGKELELESYLSYLDYQSNALNDEIYDIGWSCKEHRSVTILTPTKYWGNGATSIVHNYPVETSTKYKTKLVLQTDPLPPGCNIPIWELPVDLQNDNVLKIAEYDPECAQNTGPWQRCIQVGSVAHIVTRYHPTARQVKSTLAHGNKSKQEARMKL